MNAGLILGAVALAGLAMAAMQGKGAEADETGYIPPAISQPTPEIITEEPPPGPPGSQYQLVPLGDLSIELVGG
jgi:hypothetical protein